MATSTFSFENTKGQKLAGALETGPGPAGAFALFAHCFTCSKSSLAAVRISRALAARGVAVLRFDFTGLGESEGAFGSGLSADVADVVAAAGAMEAAGMAVSLLIGHSFGGAAVLAAAHHLPLVRAVAVIGSPFDPTHVLKHVDERQALQDGSVPTQIGGRTFHLGRAFIDDVRGQEQASRIASLGRALLVLHSPVDEVVSIDNASQIFLTAKHPKSFVSLDHADHLLRELEDADYAAACIETWSSRYVGAAMPPARDLVAGVQVQETGGGAFQVEIQTAAGRLLADEPQSVGGLGSGPTPYELLSAGLGACTAMTCRLYAARKGWPLTRVSVLVDHIAGQDGDQDRFDRQVILEGQLDAAQRVHLMAIADKCPVHKTLTQGVTISTRERPEDHPSTAAEGSPELHHRVMDQACDPPPASSGEDLV